MKTPNLSFNLLTFTHPKNKLTLWFTNEDGKNLCRFYHKLVPNEVKEQLGEQEHYYTSFEQKRDGFFAITKQTTPKCSLESNDEGTEYKKNIPNTAFTRSIMRKYYHTKIKQYFSSIGLMTKPNFVGDVQVWLPQKKTDSTYNYYEKYSLRVQICRITKGPELLISYAGNSKVFKKNVDTLMDNVNIACFNWVVYEDTLFKYDKMSDDARRNFRDVYPVWNFDIRTALAQKSPSPDRTNKYIKYKSHIDKFYSTYINTEEFKQILLIDEGGFIPVPERKIGKVKADSNKLLFYNENSNTVPLIGLNNGPYKTSEYSKIQFFFILPETEKDLAVTIRNHNVNGYQQFKGLLDVAGVRFNTLPGFSITFKDIDNPLPEIMLKLSNREFKSDIHYIAIYLSPHSKNTLNRDQKSIYYKIKELLLKREITSQVINIEKTKTELAKDISYFDYSLLNIAIAILAKLKGIPWLINAQLKNELIVGVGAFKHVDTNVQYIGSAFSFANNGQFNRFECFQSDQTDELAGSILDQIKEYVTINMDLERLIIHFYKNMSDRELKPIEDGLNKLDLDIPVFIVSINKTESNDIVAFDNDSNNLMPLSGTYINVGFNKYLLFNNVRYYSTSRVGAIDGYPFPIKLSIRCTESELEKDTVIIRDLINQVYQFSRIYWKSVRQQNLPVTIKYPEMVAEMFPYFSGNEIPEFGKDNLWFL